MMLARFRLPIFKKIFSKFKKSKTVYRFEGTQKSASNSIENQVPPFLPYNPIVIEVGAREGRGTVQLAYAFRYGKIYSVEANSKTANLDDWCVLNKINHLDFLRLDADGLELQTLKKFSLALNKAIVIVVKTYFLRFEENGTLYPELKQFLEKNNFHLLDHNYLKGSSGTATFVRKAYYDSVYSDCRHDFHNAALQQYLKQTAGQCNEKLQRHFKSIIGKSHAHHQMRNIDFIYMINLDYRPERFALAKKFLGEYGIEPYRFSAVNAKELTLEAISDVGLQFKSGMAPMLATTFVFDHGKIMASSEFMQEQDKTYFSRDVAIGAIGCTLSHLSILQDAYDRGYETIWVMEDDIEVLKDPHILSDLIDELDSIVGSDNWDVLFTDYDYRTGINEYRPASGAAKRPDMDNSTEERFSKKYTETTIINANFRTIAARFGTSSMIIRRSGISKLLQFSKERNIYSPYDLENYLVPGIKRYGLRFDVVSNQPNARSDINGAGSVNEDSFLRKYSHLIHQDILVKNSVIATGIDPCKERYDLIKPVLESLGSPFSVLDLRAAQGYFSFSIAHDFPQSTCVMMEYNNAKQDDMLLDLCFLNDHLTNITYLNKEITSESLSYLNRNAHFDFIIAFSLASLLGDDFQNVIEDLLSLGDNLIFEIRDKIPASRVKALRLQFDCQYLGEVKYPQCQSATSKGKLFWLRSKVP